MISQAATDRKNRTFEYFLMLKRKNPRYSFQEVNRLFDHLHNLSTSPHIPNHQCTAVLNSIDIELAKIATPDSTMMVCPQRK